jgi:hypothetical protein
MTITGIRTALRFRPTRIGSGHTWQAPADPNELARADRAARIAITWTLAFYVVLALLHLLKPEIDPSWRFISEYAIGRHGWLMSLAFLLYSVAWLALFVAVRPWCHTRLGRAGLALVLTSAAGLLIAGLFPTDPITTPRAQVTTTGRLHGLGGALGIAMPFAALLVTWTLSRNPAWRWARPQLWGSAAIAGAGFLVATISLGILLARSGGTFGPEVPVGWSNRLEIVCYGVWTTVLAATVLAERRRPLAIVATRGSATNGT